MPETLEIKIIDSGQLSPSPYPPPMAAGTGAPPGSDAFIADIIAKLWAGIQGVGQAPPVPAGTGTPPAPAATPPPVPAPVGGGQAPLKPAPTQPPSTTAPAPAGLSVSQTQQAALVGRQMGIAFVSAVFAKPLPVTVVGQSPQGPIPGGQHPAGASTPPSTSGMPGTSAPAPPGSKVPPPPPTPRAAVWQQVGSMTQQTAAAAGGVSAAGIIPVFQGLIEKVPVFGSALGVATGAVEAFASAADDYARRVARFSPHLSAAFAQIEVMRIQRDVRRAQESGPDLARMVLEKEEVRAKYEELMFELQKECLPVLSFIFDILKEAIHSGKMVATWGQEQALNVKKGFQFITGQTVDWSQSIAGILDILKKEDLTAPKTFDPIRDMLAIVDQPPEAAQPGQPPVRPNIPAFRGL